MHLISRRVWVVVVGEGHKSPKMCIVIAKTLSGPKRWTIKTSGGGCLCVSASEIVERVDAKTNRW